MCFLSFAFQKQFTYSTVKRLFNNITYFTYTFYKIYTYTFYKITYTFYNNIYCFISYGQNLDYKNNIYSS